MSFQTWAQSGFETIERGMNGARGSELHKERKAEFSEFLSSGVPTPRDEEWKYSDFREISEKQYELADANVSIDAQILVPFAAESSNLIVLVNGSYVESLSRLSSANVTVRSLADLLHGRESDDRIAKNFNSIKSLHERSLSSLNYGLVNGGVAIVVSSAKEFQTIEIVHVSSESKAPTVHTPRSFVIVESNASVTVIERFVAIGSGERFSCAVSEIKLGDNAECDYYAASSQNDATIHYHSLQAEVSRDARLRAHLFPFGGRLVRNEVNYNLIGSNSHSTINGLTVLTDTQHVDNSTVIRHAVPHCESSELFKGIYQHKSRGVFQGTIIVEKEAQKTNAFQSNQALLLSKEASIDSKPQLKIWADDVKCTHGATVGQLDDEALFYIRSRGISREVASALLTEAFAGEVLAGVRVPALQTALRSHLYQKLGIELPE